MANAKEIRNFRINSVKKTKKNYARDGNDLC